MKNKWLSNLIAIAGLSVVVSIGVIMSVPVPAHASTANTGVDCPVGQNVKIAPYLAYQIVSCDGGGDISQNARNKTDLSEFTLKIECPAGSGSTQTLPGSKPVTYAWNCNDNKTLPVVTVVGSPKTLAANPTPASAPAAPTGTAPSNNGQCGGVDVGTVGLSFLCANSGSSGNPIYVLIGAIANWLVYILGAVAVLVIIIAGIQYITSQGNPAALKSAKDRITNAVIGLFLLLIMFVILKFLGVAQ